MDKPWLMGIDLGGSGARCVLLNSSTGALHSAFGAWQFPPQEGTFGTGYNVDLEQVWHTVGNACRGALKEAAIDPAAVASIGVAAMRFSTVVLDKHGQAILSMDNRDARAAGEYFEVADKLGQELLEETGCWPLPLHASARLLWLRNQSAEKFNRVANLSGLGEWLNYRLCGARALDATSASATGLFSLAQREWHWQAIDALQLPHDIFPPVLTAGSPLGILSDDAAKHLGLPSGVVLGLGGGDTQCSLLGAGVIKAGQSAVVAGTTAPVQSVLASPAFDSAGKSMGTYHILPERWILESNGGGMGLSVSLLSKILFPEAPQPELRLLAEAALSEPGAAGMLSTLGADVINMQSPRMPIGQLTLSHMSCMDDAFPRRHLARALVEGCACSIRANLEQLQSVLGRPVSVDNLVLCGGLSRSDTFAQILANIADRQVDVPRTHQTAALGAALCAGVASNHFVDLEHASSDLCSVRNQFQPDRSLEEINRQLYDSWSLYHEASTAHTTDLAIDHLIPRVLKETSSTASLSTIPEGISALVSATFDKDSLKKLRQYIDVQYASFREVKRMLTGGDLVKALAGKQIFVTEIDILDAAALQKLPDLRVVAACRGDAVNVDVEACTAFGIPVVFAPGRNAAAVADLAVAFMVNLARKLPAASQFLQQEDCTAGNMGKMGQAFSLFQGHEMWHKSIGLVGLGAVGRAVAQRLAGFEVEILVADPFITSEQAALAGCRLTDLNTLLQRSDFVSLHAAVTQESKAMIGEAQFAQMKPGAFFINTARAALIDEQALVDALENGSIAGAGLDTFAEEPPGFDHPLVQHPNVICTPHSAGNTVEVANHQGESVSAALLQLLNGEKPSNILNPEVLDRFDWRGEKPVPDDTEIARLSGKGGPAVSDLQRNANNAKRKPRQQQPAAIAADIAAPIETVNKMRDILDNFCAGMAADTALNDFSNGQDVTLHFNAYDLSLEFYLTLKQGTVLSAVGAPEEPAEVQLQMRGEIIDGMFNGTVDAMECAMNGELSFVGDAAKAMTLQEIQHDMERLYKIARSEVGDPGNLAAVPRPGPANNIDLQSASSDVREDLVATMRELFESQVITATGGNVSVRIPDEDSEIWISPSRVFKGDLSADMMVRINLSGETLVPGARSPSSEWCMHTRILASKPEATAVIHAHAPNATILANSGLPFLPISTEAAFFGNIPRVPFLMPGTEELADAVAVAMQDEWAVLLINHGIIVAGRTLRRAADMVEIIERSAQVILGCYAVGKEPPVLPPDAAEHFRKMGDIVA